MDDRDLRASKAPLCASGRIKGCLPYEPQCLGYLGLMETKYKSSSAVVIANQKGQLEFIRNGLTICEIRALSKDMPMPSFRGARHICKFHGPLVGAIWRGLSFGKPLLPYQGPWRVLGFSRDSPPAL